MLCVLAALLAVTGAHCSRENLKFHSSPGQGQPGSALLEQHRSSLLSTSLGRRMAIPRVFRQSQLRATSSVRTTSATSGLGSDYQVLYPVDFGADPTGKRDSSNAFAAVLAKAWEIGEASGFNFTFGPDLGVVVDLQGGQYVFESPVPFPDRPGGNLLIQGGSIHATKSFPMGRYLFEMNGVPYYAGTADNRDVQSEQVPVDPAVDAVAAAVAAASAQTMSVLGSNAERMWDSMGRTRVRLGGSATGYDFIRFQNILFDASLRGGGVLLENTLRISFESCYFLGYAAGSYGVHTAVAGGALYVANSYASGFDWPSPECNTRKNETGLALGLEVPDGVVDNFIVACSAGGLFVNGSSYALIDVHVFGVLNDVGHGFATFGKEGHSTRVVAPYIDTCTIHMKLPYNNVIENPFALGCPSGGFVPGREEGPPAFLVLGDNDTIASAREQGWSSDLQGVSVTNGLFHGIECSYIGRAPAMIALAGLVDQCGVKDFEVSGNAFVDMNATSTRARARQYVSNGTRADFDFGEQLVLDYYSCEQAFGQVSLRTPDDPSSVHGLPVLAFADMKGAGDSARNLVRVVADRAFNGTVFVEIDQGNRGGLSPAGPPGAVQYSTA